MAQHIGGLTATLEYWGLMDVMIPFFILLIILFFLALALLNLTKMRLATKIISSVSISMVATILFIVGQVTALFPMWLNAVDFINMILPQVILYPILYVIALFPLIVIKNKKYFDITLLLIFIILSIINTSNIILLILPLSIISLVYDKRESIFMWNPIKILSIILFSIGLISTLTFLLIKGTSFYQWVNNLLGINLLYLILIIWIILWISQTIILFKKKE